MRRLSLALISAVSALAFTQIASAADLPRKAPAYMPPPPPVLSWNGFYMGLNAGWAGSSDSVTLTGTDTGAGGIGRPIGLPPGSLDVLGDRSGFIGGVQVGYNWQLTPWLVGLEADFALMDVSDSTVFGNNRPGFAAVTYGVNAKLRDLGTFRGRVGYLFTPAALLYATGGLAYGEHNLSISAVCPTCGPPANLFSENSEWNVGWTVGGGVEWMFAPRWSVKAEYLYVDLGNHDTTVNYAYGANTSSVTGSVNDRLHVVRGGINFHF